MERFNEIAEQAGIRTRVENSAEWTEYDRYFALLVTRVEQAEAKVRQQAEKVRNIAQRVLDGLDDGRMVNGLGELQAEGPRLDAYCAELDERRQALQLAANAFADK